MGIQGLLQILKPCMVDVNMNQFKGKTAAIDIMVWLYKGAYSCSYELATGKPTIEFLSYPIRMLRMLKTNGIKSICVFDGFHLKAKEETEKLRVDTKKLNRNLGHEKD